MNGVIGVLLSGAIFVGCAGTPAQKYRKTLEQPAEIQGYQCARGYAWFYADGKPASCTLARDTDYGVARAPAGSWITIDAQGKPKILQLVRDTQILGYKCRGGNWLLGPSEGATTAFYPSGKLEECWLAENQVVQGVPCAASGMFTGDSSVQFYENGRLQACKLSKDFGSLKKGQRFVQSQVSGRFGGTGGFGLAQDSQRDGDSGQSADHEQRETDAFAGIAGQFFRQQQAQAGAKCDTGSSDHRDLRYGQVFFSHIFLRCGVGCGPRCWRAGRV
jgi:hypothetical protein